ncbi:Gfo/Idh/MocA family oxidoreductase [Candidatus Woesebacteria bacterium]|jgi:predicted dehydrogenase|nr:Gfo/Idh/MocA family oxidoreductase [Candidatus Woesebacteria bacterium]
MKQSPLRVIVIGAGFFGTKRLEACLALPNTFTVVGVVDPDASSQERIKTRYKLPTASSLSLLNIPADLAIIATPNLYHAKASIEAMKYGLHVLCEKPLAISKKDAHHIALAAIKYKRIVKTGSNHRFFHTVQKAKELVDNRKIGNILFFKGSIGTNGERVSKRWFWQSAISGGGTFIDNGCHLLDIARMFMGDFKSCTATMTTNLWKQSKVEDVGSAIYITGDNRQAIITSSWIQWAGYVHIELWGEKGYIVIDSTTHDTVTVGGKDGTFVVYDYSNETKDSYHRELLYLAECIRTNKQPTPNAKDGAAVIGMIEAAYTSSTKHTWIPIK